jgi:calcium-translocating P-type ATPase
MPRNDAQQPAHPWHTLSQEEVLGHLGSAPHGLTTGEAADRLTRYGHNQLPTAKKRGPVMRFLAQFHNTLIYVLLGAALVTLLLGHVLDTCVILLVVLVNAVIGFVQEGRAEKALDAIRSMLAPTAAALRDGKRHTVAGADLVPGDVVLLEAGDKIPADLRLIKAHGLTVHEGILTGESVPVEKRLHPVAEATALGDRTCMAYSGTLVSSGQGVGVVVHTGAQTEIGRISGLLHTVETLTTPLLTQMSHFAKVLTVFILAAGGLILLFGWLFGSQTFPELFMAVVGLSVAAIPEGLPTVLTITLAIGVQKMARRKAIVRQMPAIETLGAVSVICSDKTGTLTRNEMMVATAALADGDTTVDGIGYAPEGRLSRSLDGLTPLARAAALCNDAALHQKDDHWHTEGDPMEGALLAFARKVGGHAVADGWQRLDVIPFDAKHRYMATLDTGAAGTFIHVKGAPEQVLAMCANVLGPNGKTVPLITADWHARMDAIAAQGQRVLALAYRPMPAKHATLTQSDIAGQLTLLGLVGLIDPPRPEAITAVADCRSAGIRVKMITGDHAGTAAAIGRAIGLENPDTVLTGADIDKLDDAQLAKAVLTTDIFARTSPEHKLRLVMALQAHKLVVAMTGDGVNDAPALKRADAGIAMGKKGSEAAKEAADLVLADDNFASIAAAVRHGRTVYDNLKKVITFLLPINGGESGSLIIAILFGLTLPITAAQILWVNMVSSVALAMALAFERPEVGVMRRPPRLMGAPLLSGFVVWRILFVSALLTMGVFGQFYLAKTQGYGLEAARTMAVNTLVIMEVFYLFSVRYTYGTSLTWRGIMGTPAVLIAVAAVAAFQLLFTYAPFMAKLFGTAPMDTGACAQVLAFGAGLFVVLEIEKTITRRLGYGIK